MSSSIQGNQLQIGQEDRKFFSPVQMRQGSAQVARNAFETRCNMFSEGYKEPSRPVEGKRQRKGQVQPRALAEGDDVIQLGAWCAPLDCLPARMFAC